MTDIQRTHSIESVTQPDAVDQWLLGHLPGPDGHMFFDGIVSRFREEHGWLIEKQDAEFLIHDSLVRLGKQKLIVVGCRPSSPLFWHKV